jgi:hypothetical protein
MHGLSQKMNTETFELYPRLLIYEGSAITILYNSIGEFYFMQKKNDFDLIQMHSLNFLYRWQPPISSTVRGCS